MSWEAIRGHESIRAHFAHAVTSNRLGSAYLFVGPSGVGKRRFARELAKVLLCEAEAGPDPASRPSGAGGPSRSFTACDRCPACLQVQAGTHPDLIQAQKDPERVEFTLDVIHDLRAALSLKASRNRWKIAIVDDVDDFNEEAANSFLKTLEEPPARSLLILLAVSADNVLSTIRSRCQSIQFGRVAPAHLAAILTEQGITPQPELLELAQGSVGRALSLHDAAVGQFRAELERIITDARPSAARFQAIWMEFIEQAGKEAARQRERATVAVSLFIDLIGQAVHQAVGRTAAAASATQSERLTRLVERWGLDGLVRLWDAALYAEYLIHRRVPLALIADQISEHVLRGPDGPRSTSSFKLH